MSVRAVALFAVFSAAIIAAVVIHERRRVSPAAPPLLPRAAVADTNQASAATRLAGLARTNPPSIAEPGPAAGAELARRKAFFAAFQRHPFPAVRKTGAFGWTAEDGLKPEVMAQLAHNQLELERLTEESARIYRRQLVYHTDTVDAQIQRAKLTGQPIQNLVLPGLDGQEVPFEITDRDLSPSGQQGTFSGHIAGQPDSMVTFAFKGGREAFTVLSPASNLYLVGEPREPGELIVKSINPATYVPGVCGNP